MIDHVAENPVSLELTRHMARHRDASTTCRRHFQLSRVLRRTRPTGSRANRTADDIDAHLMTTGGSSEGRSPDSGRGAERTRGVLPRRIRRSGRSSRKRTNTERRAPQGAPPATNPFFYADGNQVPCGRDEGQQDPTINSGRGCGEGGRRRKGAFVSGVRLFFVPFIEPPHLLRPLVLLASSVVQE